LLAKHARKQDVFIRRPIANHNLASVARVLNAFQLREAICDEPDLRPEGPRIFSIDLLCVVEPTEIRIDRVGFFGKHTLCVISQSTRQGGLADANQPRHAQVINGLETRCIIIARKDRRQSSTCHLFFFF